MANGDETTRPSASLTYVRTYVHTRSSIRDNGIHSISNSFFYMMMRDEKKREQSSYRYTYMYRYLDLARFTCNLCVLSDLDLM